MRRLFWASAFSGLFIIIFSSQVHADVIKVASKISEVTIYPGGALVTRQGEAELGDGEHTIVFDDIVPQVDENSLTVKGQGTAQVKIFGASVKTQYLQRSADERVKALQDQIEAVDDQIVDQNNKQKTLDNQRAYLESIKLFSGQQIPKDLVTKVPAVNDLEQLGQYVSKSFTDLETQGETIRLKLRELDRKKEALDNDLQELNADTSKAKRSIAVDIQAVRGGKLSLSVSYFVYGVNWQPVYDARVMFGKKQVDLALFGLVSQTTGEDWENASLTISTARPSVGGVMPELNSWTLRPVVPMPVYAASAQGGNMEMAFDAVSGGSVRMRAKAMSLAAAPEQIPLRKAEMAYARTEQRGITAVFKIDRPVTIKSDGTNQRVPITAVTLPAQFEYASTPKLSPYAFLRSSVENDQQAVLLPGRVNVFLDGDYVGNSYISKALGNKEQFDLYLGADEGVTVKRELVEEKSDDTLFANIPSPQKVVRYSYKITMENYKSLPITLNLFDQIPVSQDEKIKVKDVKFDPDPSKKDFKDRKGVMLWTVSLMPREKKVIAYSFAVDRPRNLDIEGL